MNDICGQVNKLAEIRHWADRCRELIDSFNALMPAMATATATAAPKKSASNRKSASSAANAKTRTSPKISAFGDVRHKVLLLMGNSGCGKTLFGDMIFREMECRPITVEIGERSLKKTFEQSTKYHNVLDYMGGHKIYNTNVGLWLDDIDILFTDSAVYTEIMEILRGNTFTMPIIATCKETDKKISEFRKFCTEIKIGKCTKLEMKQWLMRQFEKEIVSVADGTAANIDKWIEEFIQYSNSDFRTIKQLLFELKREIRLNPNYLNNPAHIRPFFEIYQNKLQEDTIFDCFQKVASLYQTSGPTTLTSYVTIKNKIERGIDMSESDSYLLSSMMNHNYFTMIQEKKGTFREKLLMGQNISTNFAYNEKNFSNYNHLSNSISYQYSIFNTMIMPSVILGRMRNLSANPYINLKYPLIFNKLSQKINNMRNLQSSFSIANESIDSVYYRNFSAVINDSSLWTKYYISYLVYQLIFVGIHSPQNDEQEETNDGKKATLMPTLTPTPIPTSTNNKKADKPHFLNPFVEQKWKIIKKYNISISDLDNWLKYYKILYWNNADDRKILTAKKKEVLARYTT